MCCVVLCMQPVSAFHTNRGKTYSFTDAFTDYTTQIIVNIHLLVNSMAIYFIPKLCRFPITIFSEFTFVRKLVQFYYIIMLSVIIHLQSATNSHSPFTFTFHHIECERMYRQLFHSLIWEEKKNVEKFRGAALNWGRFFTRKWEKSERVSDVIFRRTSPYIFFCSFEASWLLHPDAHLRLLSLALINISLHEEGSHGCMCSVHVVPDL